MGSQHRGIDSGRQREWSIFLPANASVLRYLKERKPQGSPFALPDGSVDPYYGCGCHPDIVERLWDQIGAALPVDSRCLVYGTPALVHPDSGVVLGIGVGTQYALRLPGSYGEKAIMAGAKTNTIWSGGDTLDIRRDFGDEWVFGAWITEEPTWCEEVYRLFDELHE